MLNRFLVVILSAVMCAAPATAQQQQQQQSPTARTPAQSEQEETVRVGSTAVHVDVIVTDKVGRRITGLTASDFQVLDEGAPAPLDFFTAIEGSRVSRTENRGGASAAASTTTTPATDQNTSNLLKPYPGRHIAIVMDDPSMSNETFMRTRESLSQYIDKLTPADMLALVSTGGRMASFQQFTNDKQRLLSAVRRVAPSSQRSQQAGGRFHLSPSEAARINAGDETVLDAVTRRASAESLANQSGGEGSIANETRGGTLRASADGSVGEGVGTSDARLLRDQIRNEAQGSIGEIAAGARNTLKTLANLFQSMAELPGRKVVLLLSESFVTLGGTSEDQTNLLQQVIDLARRAGISVYALDAGGLRTNSTTASEYTTGVGLRARDLAGGTGYSDFENLGAARAIAAGTGGAMIANTNDIVGGLDRAVEDSSSYYVVGFRPGKLDNKFHRLTVTVKGKPDLVVRTRRGYLAVNQETVKGTNAELASALLSPVPRIDLPLEVVANVEPQGGEQLVLTGLHVGRNYLSLPAAGAPDQKASYEVVAWVFQNGQDRPVGAVSKTVVYDLAAQPADRQKLATAGFIFVPQPFKLGPGQYQIRAAVREQSSGAIGSSYQFFEVPDLADRKAVSLSGLLLTGAGQTGFNGVNSFKPNSEMDVRYVLYNPPKDLNDLTQRVRLMDAKGAVMMDSPLAFAPATGGAAGAAAAAPQGTRLKVPPRRGRYSLIFNVKDKKGKVDIERRADFVVE
ncbi:MAG: hypothetical protein QOJ76_3462 [Acidobacteriota bacterium]|nr:hypothetical protein [Acidobacteriota bacterium]